MGKRILHVFCVTVIIFFTVSKVKSQQISSPEQMALSGGVSYVAGTSAHFYNPANLMIRNKRGSFQISMGTGGFYTSNGIPTESHYQLIDHLKNKIRPIFVPDEWPEWTIMTDDVIENRFGDKDHYYQTRKYELIPITIHWQDEYSARSISLRSRGFSSFEMNRTWFDINDPNNENIESFKRFLNEKYFVSHELSLGLAREVTMFNRWNAGLNTLLIGFSPKIIIGGMHSEFNFESEYFPLNDIWQNSRELKLQASGDISRFVTDLMEAGFSDDALKNHLNQRSNLEINGFGAGIDAGLTYIIPLGNDVSLSPHINSPLKKSLRFSIAITDFGMIRFNNHSQSLDSQSVIQTYEQLPVADHMYSGYPGDFFRYLNSEIYEQDIFNQPINERATSYTIQLPTELHLGAAIQYNRFVSLIDFKYGFNPYEFETAGWQTSIGTEIHIFPFLPIRGSIQMNPDRSFAYGGGAGLDFGYFNISTAVKLFNHNKKNGAVWYLNSASVLSMQIRF